MNVTVQTIDSLSLFIRICVDAEVRLARFSEDSFVQPGNPENGTTGMLGMERFTLTAFDKQRGIILRWEKAQPYTGEASKIRSRLEIEGIQVVEGEWKAEELEEILNGTE